MKKILALVSFLLVAAACTNQPSMNTGTNSNAKMTAAKTAAPSEADMIVKEKAAWETLKKKDYAAFGDMLASDYIEVTDEGNFDKAGIVADVKDFIPTDIALSDWKMLPIDNDAVILTYSVTVKATYKGKDIPPGPYRAAAAWVNRDGKWLAFYYQQTPVKPMPPPPAASPSKPEKAPATPLAKPAETGSDPIANEKIVWDTFKTKNYDAFAAVLDPAFVELESTGVYDKAGAVKSVEGFDATKFELSEWKSARLDNDAALVTYLVKPSDPKWDTERHTSIWANRNGKWVALLHVGTPIAKPAAK
ncbi:MAG TPA: nuclear transport factor 2 family protein [Pyrinomonadaceae bacterium]|nr:nuclear transport factor 2 family protein [Pyrinomonadaceae bacterium]